GWGRMLRAVPRNYSLAQLAASVDTVAPPGRTCRAIYAALTLVVRTTRLSNGTFYSKWDRSEKLPNDLFRTINHEPTEYIRVESHEDVLYWYTTSTSPLTLLPWLHREADGVNEDRDSPPPNNEDDWFPTTKDDDPEDKY